MITMIRQLFGRRMPRPASRLSESEVLAIAKAAASDALKDLTTMSSIEQHNGRLVWHIRSATIGSGLTVTVDDATGDVIEKKRWGVR